MEFFRIFFAFCLIIQALSVPVPQASGDFECSGDNVLNYESGQEYTYEYETDTTLFINDISDEAKSELKLKTNLVVSALGQCNYMLRLEGTQLTGESMSKSSDVDQQLDSNAAVFRMNSEGELDSNVDFQSGDNAWSKNIKRAIISAFQVKSYSKLRSADGTNDKSSVTYENDVLGRCRTTYSIEDGNYHSEGSYSLEKKKSLQRCTLVTSQANKYLGAQYVPYKQIPEFFDGRLFIEDYSCKSVVKDNLVNSVECKELSTFKPGSRGVYGVQAIVSQSLQFVSASSSSASRPSDLATESISFEYYDSKSARIETEGFDGSEFTSEICENALETGLSNEHALKFKDLTYTMKGWSVQQMVDFYTESKGKCDLAGLTAAQAIVFTKTDNSVEAALSLIDSDSFADQKYITEYPILTALARNPEPSHELVATLKEYLSSKSSDFPYYNKLALVYSTLAYTHCTNVGCSESQKAEFSSVFADNIKSDCSIIALKAVGNIGAFADLDALNRCASDKSNSLETRVVTAQAVRRFSCANVDKMTGIQAAFGDTSEDSEVRISAFLALVRCLDESEGAQEASKKLPEFLLKEEDHQVFVFVVRYGKEHGLSTILNAALDDPRIRAKFETNIKTLSFTRFRYHYNVLRDAALEAETTVIYTPQTWVPRSINFNMTTHAFGGSVNMVEANLRLEGMDEILKAAIIDKLRSEKFMKRIMEDPQQLIDILQIVADKLQYTRELPKMTMSLRVYGSDVMYSNIDNKENFLRLANFIKSPRQTVLYRQVEAVKNFFLIDTEIRQPLVNGLSFNRYLDISSAVLLSKHSNKDEQNDELNFHVNNFWSMSGSFRGIFEVAFNKENKLSLKKKSMVNARLRMNVEGFKKEGNWKYNVHLSPMTEIPVFTADGQFYKLGGNSVYNKVNEFKTTQKEYEVCDSEKFVETFGLKLCLSVSRPELGNVVQILRGRRQGDLQNDFAQYLDDIKNDFVDGEDNFHDDNNKRPTLILAGPYHYELKLSNPQLVKTVVFDVNFDRSLAKSDVSVDVSTIAQSGVETKKVQLAYSRERQTNLRGIHRRMSIQLKNVESNEVRFNFLAQFLYKKQEVLNFHLECENKVLRPFHHKLTFGRDKSDEENIVPKWHLEIIMDRSQTSMKKKYNLYFDMTPNGRDVSSKWYLEASSGRTQFQAYRVLNGEVTMTSNSEDMFDYTVELHAYNKLRQANLDVTGNVVLSLFKSDIDLVIDYKNPRVNLPKPANLRFSHKFDASSNSQSYVSAHVDHAYRNLDHGFKATFVFDVIAKKLSLFHLDLNKPGPNPTVQLFFEKNESEGSTTVRDVKLGIRKTQIELPSAAGTLIKVDGDKVLRSLVLHFTRTHTKGAKIAHELYVKKNEKVMVTIKDSIYGDRAAVRNNLLELPKTSFGVDFYMKVMDNSGAFSVQLDLEASKSNQKFAAEFNAKTENLFKILSRIASYKVKISSSKDDFDYQIEMKRLGEVKGFKLYSTSGLRRSGNSAEFDLAYEKRLANGKKLTGNGVGAFTFDNFKNYESSVQVDGHYNHKISIKNTRDESQTGLFGYHNFQFENSHLDFEPYSRKVILFIEDTRNTAGNFDFKIDFRKGQVNNLDSRDALLIFSSISSENSFANGKLVKSLNGLNAKSARFNLDFEKESNLVINSNGVKYDAKTNLKIPAIITDPGKLNTLNHEMHFTVDKSKKATLMNRFKTDSKLFGRLFRVLDIDFDREVNANTNLVNANLEVNYKLRKNPADSEMKNWRFKIEHDLHTKTFKEALQKGYKFKVNLKQNRFNEYKTRFLPVAQPLKVTDCTYDEVLKREKTSSKYYLDLDLNIACNGVLFSNTGLTIDRTYNEDHKPSTRIQLDTNSDVFYKERHIKLAHDKFTKKHGLVSVSINVDGRTPFANEFYYDRSVNPVTNEMKDAHYHVATSFGPVLSKACDFNVVSGVDLYNAFSCRLNTTKVPDVELNYGYNYKSTNVGERIFGKRNFELDIIVPGRTLRAEYNRNYPSYFDGNDDDEDPNNEREFNATAVLYWDYVKQPEKFLTINAKRDNFAKGKSTTFIELVDSPHFKFLRFKVDKTRTHNDTTLAACAMYEMKNGNKNCLTVTGILSSNLNTNSLSLETNLERPSFNTLYENRFNKHNGRLQYLGIRVGKVLKLSVDKEYDPEERRVSLELTNPDESKYTFEGKSDMHDQVYTVEGTLSQNSEKLSNVVSKFDARNANFDVKIKGLVTRNNYRINFGVFDETLANAYIKNENTKELIGKTELKIVKSEDQNELVMSMRWNRFWGQIQKDILGNNDENLVVQNDQFNSYFGDIYGEVTKDLNPLVSVHREERQKVRNDFRNLFGILIDFYSNFLNPEMKSKLQRMQMQQMVAAMEARLSTDKNTPIYKKVLRKYNAFAKRMTALSLYLRRYSKNLSRAVPRFPTYEYNQESSEFQNNLVVRRPTLYAQTLYQFNHEYRDYVRKAGRRFLALKGTLVRPNLGGMGLKALYNKYKYRSVSSYTLVGHVFNKRNIIGFDGESVILQSRCQYLLAHETHKNRFSVVLNFEKGNYPISVYAYGKSVDIGYSSAQIKGQAASLPQNIALGDDNGVLTVQKTHDSVCVELNKDMKVCCYDDSKSCTVAATRWFTGKLNGLLGKADNDPQEINQQDWFLKKKCRFPNAKTRLSAESAVKTCYSLFGRHKKAAFRNAIQTIKPDAWQKVCSSVLTANIKYKCAVMRAFVHHASVLSVSVNAADECFSCQMNKHNYAIGQSVPRYAAASPFNFAKGADIAMVILPCAYKQEDFNKLDIQGIKTSYEKFRSNSENRMTMIRVEADDASFFQSDDGKIYNYDDDDNTNKAWNYEKDGEISEKAFEKAMFLAGSFLSQRLAQNRVIVINSCGNCLPYKFKVAKWAKIFKNANVAVHSYGNYEIKDLESDDSESVSIAYGNDKVHIYNRYDEEVETDHFDDYKLDHEHDMCSRLAVKTGGLVLRGDKSFPETSAYTVDLMLNEHKKYSYNVQTCHRIDTSYGDLTGFSYTKTEVESEDSEDDYDY